METRGELCEFNDSQGDKWFGEQIKVAMKTDHCILTTPKDFAHFKTDDLTLKT